MALLLWVPLGAFIVSFGFNLWQVRDRRRARRPRVTVTATGIPGASSWPGVHEGQYPKDTAVASYLAGTISAAGSVTIVDARLAPPDVKPTVALWDALPVPDIYVGDPSMPDSGRRENGMGIAQSPDEYVAHRFPKSLTDGELVVRVEYGDHDMPTALRRSRDARLWIKTDTGDRFVSEVAQLHHRFRGDRGAPPEQEAG